MLTLKLQGFLQIDAGVELWNTTDGLCGRMDGLSENDLSYKSVASFANKWVVNGLNDICESPMTEILNVSEEISYKALQFCSVMKSDRFNVCRSKNLNVDAYVDVCKIDYTQCIQVNGSDCGCSSIAAFAEECFERNHLSSWRDNNLCRKG